ncbi:unnamed protein product [Rotaria socialis]|uniref:V-SNARE coiled-coil homology domain-containing protein n=2 Tax=Rotaria socialis TaxID=392032 RepID=A0A820G8I4_9BILA|nr:unnamed protein product [Rotaria socialis]
MTSRIKLPFKLGDSKKINEFEVNETSRKEDFSLSEIVRYGFPYRPTTLAYDSVQKILAIGTKHGIIKIYGGAFVECSLSHPTEVEIVQLVFRINEGALISACRDNFIHLWNLRQKKPAIAQSLRFVKERISRCLLPLAFNSKWLLVGTHFGNVYVINLDTFTLSSYKIMWNNAIGMGKSTHPGVVIDLCQNPDDSTRLYIGFSTHISSPNNVPVGHVVCWNLQQKTSETVYTLQEGLTSISWHYDGRQFMCSHCDGSLSVWNLRTTDKPVSINYPHTRISKDELRKFGSISKVVWSSVKNTNDTFIIFSGGMPNQADPQQISAINTNIPPSKPSPFFLTILRGQTTNVLHMDNAIVDFHVITASPHIADAPDPLAIAVLLENDLVMIDLKSENYPLFESLHTLDLHESPVTYCDYITEPNSTFYQSLLRLQTKQVPKRTYSQQENPISGGKSGSTIFGYNELIITGHADGSIKFWDASGCNLLFFYKLRTNRLFDRTQAANLSSSSSSATTTTASSVSNKKESNTNYKLESRPARANSNAGDEINQSQINSTNLSNELNVYEFPFAIYSIKMCCDGKYLIAAARGGHVTLFKFTGSELDKADEGLGDFSLLEIPIFHQNISNDHNEANTGGNLSTISDFQSSVARPTAKDFKSLLRAKKGYRRMAGYQPELVCLLSWLPSDKIPVLTDTSINSKYGLLIFGLDNGLVVIDYLSTSILMNMATADLYGTMDPFQRTSISPKRRVAGNDFNNDDQTSGDYQHQPLSPTPCTVESGLSFNPFACGYAGHSANKPRSKQSIPCMSPYSTNDVSSTPFFHSRSIDSLPGNDQTLGSPPTVGDGGFHDEKSHNTGTLSKTFRTFRSRWSRPSTFDKHDSSLACINSDHSEKENAAKSGGDDNGGSSGGEEINQSPVRGKRATSPDITRRSHKPLGTTVSLNANRSFPSDKRSRIVTTPPPLKSTESNDKNDDSGSGSETTNLSKTWTSSAYNHAKLRGTCSLEYTEHMREKSHKRKAHMVDLRKDDAHQQQQSTMMTSTSKHSISTSLTSSNNHPQSSPPSTASAFTEKRPQAPSDMNSVSYFTISPSVWLGTSTGCVLVINLNIIYEPRNISVVPSGSVFRMCGRLLHISFLDHKGVLIPSPSEKWDARKPKANRSNDGTQDLNASSILSGSNVMSSSVANTQSTNIQYAVFCTSKQARVVSLPSQACISKQKIYDSLGASASNVFRAAVVKIAGSLCLTCYLSGGRIHVYSLPSLRELFVTNLDIAADTFRSLIASTCIFTDRGHGLFMCSPTEIQKLSIASDVKEQISEMLCELYDPSIAMPEAPKQNFFAKIFASNTSLDSDQLFGEAAGKAPYGVAKKEDVNANMNRMRGTVDSACGAVNDTRNKLIERGQKLGEVEIASKQMSDRAEELASLTHKVLLKQKEKAEWWSFSSKKS